MKRYLIFILSFLFLFVFLNISAGLLLTATYTPDVTNAWERSRQLSQEVTFGNRSPIPTFLIATLAATIAYVVSARWAKK